MGLFSACLTLGFRNLAAHKARSLAAGAGICFALFLIFLQWGFLQAAKKQITLLYTQFDYDLVLLSETYQFMFTAQPFDRVRLMQAGALPSVQDSFGLNFAITNWEDKTSKLRSSLLLLGVDRKPEFILDERIRDGVRNLNGGRNILIDAFSHSDFGPLIPGTRALINRQEVEIASQFNLGMFFYTEGAALVDNTAFVRLSRRPSRDVNFGLIRLRDGYDPWVEKAKLERLLPDDVIVLSKSDLIDKEQHYFINVKPLGIVFKVGVFIAFVTGAVILFQVISTDIGTRMNEYATLKAMGFGIGFIYGSAMVQTMMLALTAFAFSCFISIAIFRRVYELTHLPAEVNSGLIEFVLVVTLMMCLVIGVSALRKLSKAHPADLY
ncbi:MAG: ABC transporter permease [Chromatiaceae bacterium]|nr:ABC transporter permease [Chromatiaceae bacterium]